MDNNNEKKETGSIDILKEILGKVNHVDTPSEKICKLALERDKTYDKVYKLEKDLETAKENNEDCTFLEAQLQHLKDYKKLLGDQIKKLVDEKMQTLDKRTFKVCEAVALGLTHYYLNNQHDKREVTDKDRIKALHIIPKLPRGWMRKGYTHPWSCMNKTYKHTIKKNGE